MSQTTPRADDDTPLSEAALRAALGRFTTGVTVIACRDAAGAAVGLTVNSFAALSLSPPLVLWSLRQASASLPSFAAASHFSVNVLDETQLQISRQFSHRLAGQPVSRFDLGEWSDGLGGAPVLAGALSVFECAVHSQQAVGDHVLFIGEVQRLREGASAGAPLVYHGAHYHALGGRL